MQPSNRSLATRGWHWLTHIETIHWLAGIFGPIAWNPSMMLLSTILSAIVTWDSQFPVYGRIVVFVIVGVIFLLASHLILSRAGLIYRPSAVTGGENPAMAGAQIRLRRGTFIGTIGIVTIVAIGLTALIVDYFNRPSVVFHFEPSYPLVTIPERREVYGNYSVAIKIESKTLLKNAFARLLSIYKSDDPKKTPINGFAQPTLAWPTFDKAFEPRTTGIEDYIVIMSVSRDGKTLSFLMKEENIPELQKLKKN